MVAMMAVISKYLGNTVTPFLLDHILARDFLHSKRLFPFPGRQT